jgi:hypothetical protein
MFLVAFSPVPLTISPNSYASKRCNHSRFFLLELVNQFLVALSLFHVQQYAFDNAGMFKYMHSVTLGEGYWERCRGNFYCPLLLSHEDCVILSLL